MARLVGHNQEKIQKEINVDHFKEDNIMIDIYFDFNMNNGTVKIKRVGYVHGDGNDEDYEIVMTGLNNCSENTKNEWIPHYVFPWDKDNEQKIMMTLIQPSGYGFENDIQWCH